MGLFSKPEYIEAVLPFTLDPNEEDVEACIISIEAFGRILDEPNYYYASFECRSDDYDGLAAILDHTDNKLVKVIAKVKNGKIRSFDLDLKDLAVRLGDPRFTKLSMLGYGINGSSFKETAGRPS